MKLEANIRLTEVLNFQRKSLIGDLEGFIAKLSVKLYPFIQFIEKKILVDAVSLYASCRNGIGIKKLSFQFIFII